MYVCLFVFLRLSVCFFVYLFGFGCMYVCTYVCPFIFSLVLVLCMYVFTCLSICFFCFLSVCLLVYLFGLVLQGNSFCHCFVGPGVYYGSLEFKNQSYTESVALNCRLLPYQKRSSTEQSLKSVGKEADVPAVSVLLTDFHVLVAYNDRSVR